MPKLLLVEDDNNLREIYQARLMAEGYDIVTAKDGEEALVVAKAEKPDLVVSDVMMPKISGFEMLDILRNTEGLEHVKVIMLTALGQTDDQARADKLGADRYLVKSQVTLEDIVNSAHALLQEAGLEEGEAPAEAAPAAPAPEAAPAPAPAPAVEAPAAAPAPAPLAPAPAPETPVAAPPAEPVVPAPAPEAQSASDEAAAVDANIESFVAGASSEAPAPVASAPVVSTPAQEAAPAPAPVVEAPVPATPTAEENATTDEKVMEDAVKSLNEATTPAPEAAPAEPAPATDAPATPEVKPADNVGGMKVITPTEGEDKKDIHDLLAIEEAKEAAQASTAPAAPLQPPAVPSPPAPDVEDPTGGTPPPEGNDGSITDPSSIAL